MEQNREWGPPVPKGSGIDAKDLPDTLVYVVTPGYFRAMGMRLRGRDFTSKEAPKGGPGVVILNETVTCFLPEEAIHLAAFRIGPDRALTRELGT